MKIKFIRYLCFIVVDFIHSCRHHHHHHRRRRRHHHHHHHRHHRLRMSNFKSHLHALKIRYGTRKNFWHRA